MISFHISVKCEINRSQNMHDPLSGSLCKHVTNVLTKMHAHFHKNYNTKSIESSHDIYMFT